MFYHHIDHLISTRVVTDSDKNIVAAVTYHPFGEPRVEEGSEKYLFTGKEIYCLLYIRSKFKQNQNGR
jgi:hypothetical protein